MTFWKSDIKLEKSDVPGLSTISIYQYKNRGRIKNKRLTYKYNKYSETTGEDSRGNSIEKNSENIS